jgi:hypothetical protein
VPSLGKCAFKYVMGRLNVYVAKTRPKRPDDKPEETSVKAVPLPVFRSGSQEEKRLLDWAGGIQRSDGMSYLSRIVCLATVVASIAVPAAFAAGPPSNAGTQNAATHAQGPTGDVGPDATPAAKAKAYGNDCQNQSKKHVDGQKGTPFSQCVTAMAKLASGTTDSPTKACSTVSKEHVDGQHGTPFSLCVAAGAKLLKS